jgi:hypothetical protein
MNLEDMQVQIEDSAMPAEALAQKQMEGNRTFFFTMWLITSWAVVD